VRQWAGPMANWGRARSPNITMALPHVLHLHAQGTVHPREGSPCSQVRPGMTHPVSPSITMVTFVVRFWRETSADGQR
jgi:hypothetical protein